MHGHLWSQKVKIRKVQVEHIDKELWVVWVRWWVPWWRNSLVKLSLN